MNVIRHVGRDEEPEVYELTLEDFRTLHDAGALDERAKVELIDGVLYEVAAQKNRHSFMKSELGRRLANRLEALGSPLKAIVEPSFDLRRKAALYARHGVAEYWVVDVARELVHRQWSAAESGYQAKDKVPLGGRRESVTIPDLAIDTANLV
jgi:Uma2 family endonuclease